ncbi:MAG TPA: hypothetical protein VKA97_05985 [Pyrinomonadaceae bacterium]|nr:hypothetical protein [Pyrinomonadaceae bacterium]
MDERQHDANALPANSDKKIPPPATEVAAKGGCSPQNNSKICGMDNAGLKKPQGKFITFVYISPASNDK